VPPMWAYSQEMPKFSSKAVMAGAGANDAEEEEDKTTRTLNIEVEIDSKLALVLLDSGASSNFISSRFVEGSNLPVSIVVDGPSVILPDGARHQCHEVVQLKLQVQEYQDKVQAYVFPLVHYDLILGMSWLSQVNPIIDWQTGTIQVKSCLIQSKKRESHLLASIPGCLCMSMSSQTLVDKIKYDFQDVIVDKIPDQLPPSRDCDHVIKIVNQEGVKLPRRNPYRMSYEELSALKAQLNDLLRKGFIRRSRSSASSPVLFVKKKSGELRLCVDYRALNAVTIKDATPLPRIDEILDKIQGATIFSKLDLSSAYHQVRVAEDSIPLTAFTTPLGLFEWCVLPFGLCNAPATFTSLMMNIFEDDDSFVVVYLDDILIFSKDVESHQRHVAHVLHKLRQHRLLVHPRKSEFFIIKVTFLGHVLTPQGVHMDTDKIKTIQEWPRPMKVKDIQAFLGMTGYYRRFVVKYSQLALPLTKLLKNGAAWEWGTEQEQSFQDLKKTLISAPVLLIPDPNKPFVVNTDASKFAMGGVLAQDQGNGLQPVAYWSAKLNPAEVNYSAYDKELLAVTRAVQHWRHYLLGGVKSHVYTDHNPLKYLSTQKQLNQRQARMHQALTEFNLHLDYPGKLNKIADCLSRRPDHAHNTTEELSSLFTPTSAELIMKIKTSYGRDSESKNIIDKLNTDHSRFQIRDGLLINEDNKIYVPNDQELRELLIREHHDSVVGGHLGMDKTQDFLSRNYYWPQMSAAVRRYVRQCTTCITTKSSNQKPGGLLFPLNIPNRNWEVISFDLITGLPKTTAGHDSIVVFVDKLSKMVHCAPITQQITTPEFATVYLDRVVKLHGLSETLISDRDPRFTSRFWRDS
jgi:hypothetical protein